MPTRFPTFSKLSDVDHDTAKAYAVPGFVGRVGFITSMSDHFCGSCNRLRITADGNIKVLCFAGFLSVSCVALLIEYVCDATRLVAIAGVSV